MIAEVVARHRAILLAEGKLVFPVRTPGEDPDGPWEGVPCTHLNDDRRIPLLWTKGGVAQTLVNPNEPFWYRLEDCSVVPGGKMFKDLATLDEMGPEMRAKYQHCGLVPEFSYWTKAAVPVEEVRRKGSGGCDGKNDKFSNDTQDANSSCKEPVLGSQGLSNYSLCHHRWEPSSQRSP